MVVALGEEDYTNIESVETASPKILPQLDLSVAT